MFFKWFCACKISKKKRYNQGQPDGNILFGISNMQETPWIFFKYRMFIRKWLDTIIVEITVTLKSYLEHVEWLP